MINDLSDLLVALGVGLSFFLIILILSSRSFRSDVHLYFAITIAALNLILTYTWFEDDVPNNGLLEIISWEFLFPFTFLLYVLKAIKDPIAVKKWLWLLAIPALIFSSIQSLNFFADIDFYYWAFSGDEARFSSFREVITFSNLLFAIALIGYAFFKVGHSTTISAAEKHWLQLNSFFLLIFLLFWLLGEAITPFFNFEIWKYLLALLSFFLIIITYFGVHHLNISEQRRSLQSIRTTQLAVQKTKLASAIQPATDAPAVSAKTEMRLAKLQQLMRQDQLYRNPKLSRKMVAEVLNISEGYLSVVMKTALGLSFNEYVNNYRIDEVIRLFRDEQFAHYSVEAIGLEAGFRTRSVFYTTFKNATGKTPGAYRKTLKMS